MNMYVKTSLSPPLPLSPLSLTHARTRMHARTTTAPAAAAATSTLPTEKKSQRSAAVTAGRSGAYRAYCKASSLSLQQRDKRADDAGTCHLNYTPVLAVYQRAIDPAQPLKLVTRAACHHTVSPQLTVSVLAPYLQLQFYAHYNLRGEKGQSWHWCCLVVRTLLFRFKAQRFCRDESVTNDRDVLLSTVTVAIRRVMADVHDKKNNTDVNSNTYIIPPRLYQNQQQQHH